jgi:anti-sigma factor ChrR (cupin superfamily)
MLTNSCDCFSTEKRQVAVSDRPTLFLVRNKNQRSLPGPLNVSALCACRWRGRGLRHPALVLSTGARPRITAAVHATLEALETRCVQARLAVK